MSKRAGISVLLLFLALVAGGGEARAALSTGTVTLAPGTSPVVLGDAVFTVSTDRTISLSLSFSGDLLEGLVTVRDVSPAQVLIYWRNNGVTVFTGAVVQIQPIRYQIPVEYQATEDSGHTEK